MLSKIKGGETMRTDLKVFRVKQKMTQEEFANKIGFSRSQYALIEQGNRNGTIDFWDKLKNTFEIPDTNMWRLMQNDKEE